MMGASLLLAAGAAMLGAEASSDPGSAACSAAIEGLLLDFPIDQQARRTLPDRSVYYWMSGRVTNRGSVPRELPPLIIVFRNSEEDIVLTHEIDFGGKLLDPGESVEVERAVANTPRSARYRELTWRPCLTGA